jgi:hypothetical protein
MSELNDYFLKIKMDATVFELIKRLDATIFESIERLNLIIFRKLEINYCDLSRTEYPYIPSRSFMYNSQSSNILCRWKNYNGEKTIVVKADDIIHLKIFFWDLIENIDMIFPFHIIVLAYKSLESLERNEFPYKNGRLDNFVMSNRIRAPYIFLSYVGNENYDYLESDDGVILVRYKRTYIVDIFSMSQIKDYALYYGIGSLIL